MIRVTLAEYDPQWAAQFEVHRARIAAALGDRVEGIEHIGSTSVPGLAAKPVVDVLLTGLEPADEAARSALEAAGYELAVDEAGHRMYRTAKRDAHLHVWAAHADEQRHVLFRDWLREHPEDRALYEHVKRELAKREWPTREHYADAKSAVIETIVRRARGEATRAHVDAFAALLLDRVPAGARVLEIGAGEGLLAQTLSAAGRAVVALDLHLRSTFPIVESAFESYDAPPQSVDCIAAQLVLHHAAGLAAMLDKCAALLAPGGTIAVDDYGWERSRDERYRNQRSDLHTGQAMLAALRERFTEIYYAEHGHVRGAEGDPFLGFTFFGKKH